MDNKSIAIIENDVRMDTFNLRYFQIKSIMFPGVMLRKAVSTCQKDKILTAFSVPV